MSASTMQSDDTRGSAPRAAAASLACFQQQFAAALLDRRPLAEVAESATNATIAALLRQPGAAVYRNTVMRGLIDALEANYPAVVRVVGDEWFRASAAVFVRQQAPSQPSLLAYGEGFAAFIAAFEPAAELHYLPAVAQLDRCWTESHLAADATPLLVSALPAGADLADVELRIHPAARWRWFNDVPAFTLWQRNRAEHFDPTAFDWIGEGALFTRPAGDVRAQPLSRAGVALLDACTSGATLGTALIAAMDAPSDESDQPASADALVALLNQLIVAGAFAASP
jgi:hypothetical protein